jgi:DNA-binding NarL/FixJ family response regulator
MMKGCGRGVACREWAVTSGGTLGTPALAFEARELPEDARIPTVLLIEDHGLLAEALVSALRAAGVAADVVSGPTVDVILEHAAVGRPDVVLLDLMLGDDIDVAVSLIEPLCATGASVLLLTGATNPSVLGACLEAGVFGLVSKSETFEMVLEKVLRAGRRQETLRASERDALLASLSLWRAQQQERLAPFERLTERERMVLSALMDGSCAEGIATASLVSLATVRSQIRAILQKLGVRSQVAAVAAAHRAGWQYR